MISRYCIAIIGLFPLVATAQPSLIVRLHDNAPPALITALGEEGAAKQGPYAALFDGVVTVQPVIPAATPAKRNAAPFLAFTLTVADSAALNTLLDAWAARPGVAYAQPNRRYRLDARGPPAMRAQADPMLDSLAHMPIIRGFEAWSITDGSPDVRVGFVDTGVLFDHPDLAGQFWINPGEDRNGNGQFDASDLNGIDDDGNGFIDDVRGYDFVDRATSVEQGDYLGRDPDASEDDRPGGGRGHGTLIAGVLGAGRDNDEGIAGVAPGCRLVPLRAFGADGLGEDDDVAAAIVYAAELGLDVLNLSFGDVYYSPIMQEAIAYAVAQGTVVVASAGNLGGDDPHYPSDYPEVISVAWLDSEGSGIAGRGTFGIGIDVGAPGSFIFTTLMPRLQEDGTIDPEDYYGRRSGSSMAAPMVAGTAALLRSLDPDLSPNSVRSILTGTAVDLSEPGWDHRTAAGRLDVLAALQRNLPARVGLTAPAHDAGWAGDALAIVGSAVTPSFDAFSLSYTEGDADLTGDWQPIAGPIRRQHLDDTLAVWQTGALAEGVYTLRLAVTLRTGQVIEDRRRIYLDRTPPTAELRLFNRGLVGGAHGIAVDLETDDLTEVTLRVAVGGGEVYTERSDRRSRRHGVAWADVRGRGGAAQVTVDITNAAGLTHTLETAFTIPSRQVNTALFDETTLAVPHGYLLQHATDFDADGLLEITLNRYQDGWIGDTLSTYEWDGAAFRLAGQLLANVIPRDVGDPDGDGLLELLTQVAGATLVLEQSQPGTYPTEVSFIDTTGLANPFDPQAAFGARLTDLDADGRGEVLVHNTRQWRVLEYTGSAFTETLRLDNPTSVTRSEISQNEFQQPLVLIDDFDGDGRTNLLAGDGDGDWIMYETTGNDALAVTWTYETIRYNAGARFAKGDFDGDGLPEFVTYTQNWTQPIGPGDREPDTGLYYVWDSTADDTYVLADSLPLPGLLSRHGGMIGADLDGDGRDELVLVHAPDLYVLGFDDALRWSLRYHRGAMDGDQGMRSVALVAGDFDGDGLPDLIAAGADERLHRFALNQPSLTAPPPVWEQAVALNAQHVALAWRAGGADSVTVYRGVAGGPLDPVATTTAETLQDAPAEASRYVLRGWFGGTMSALSEERHVRPHAPAVVQSVTYPAPTTAELLFTEPLAPATRTASFALDAGGVPDAVLLTQGGRAVTVRFKALAARTDTLRWVGLIDAEGTPVGQAKVAVSFPAAMKPGLIITEWEITGAATVALRFSEPLDPDFAGDVANYRMEPSGRVATAQWQAAQPEEVMLTVEGRAIGATGLETSLVVERMRSSSGTTLAVEGNTISLTQAAETLADVYVFPNPYREAEHQPRIVVAGLPPEATISIFSVQGEPVRRLRERDGDGGVAWDLTDDKGQRVPSGIYLVRVEAPDQQPVLRKAAVIR